MCLATPMKIEKILEGKKAIVSQGTVNVQIDISLLENPKPGDHVIVHAGFAIEILSLAEAEERLELFRRMAELIGDA
jgi:hydrogenase expression/formation protein HypC